MMSKRVVELTKRDDGYGITFDAMASACEVIVETQSEMLASRLGKIISDEVWRIEDKFSRYNRHSVCSKINRSSGQAVSIDNETYLLLSFANQCFELSGGLFDISSGVLRGIWNFDTSDNIPSPVQVAAILPLVGWKKITYDHQSIVMPAAMELDFGGIGKEYAVDRAMLLATQLTDVPILVNLGGDLCASGPRANNQPWQVGIEHPGFIKRQTMVVSLYRGALATSGDAKRYLLRDGKRYSHILNANTGWPIEEAPASVTIAAEHCVEAGILATLSTLQGAGAESFLKQQQVTYWLVAHAANLDP